MNDHYPTARLAKQPHRPRVVSEDTMWDEIRPYLWQTLRNITTVVVSVVILAVMFRAYLWVETERQADGLRAAREQAVQKNLARQAEIEKEMGGKR